MERNPFMSLNDDTVITHSDIKYRENGEEYITLYFETPSERIGFCSMDIEYPNGKPSNVVGYTKEEISRLMYHYNKVGVLAFEDAKEVLKYEEEKQ